MRRKIDNRSQVLTGIVEKYACARREMNRKINEMTAKILNGHLKKKMNESDLVP